MTKFLVTGDKENIKIKIRDPMNSSKLAVVVVFAQQNQKMKMRLGSL